MGTYIKTYPAAEVIQKCLITDYLGIVLGQEILSPLRVEKNASFHVFIHDIKHTQQWIDHGGEHRTGDIIQLHQLLTGQTNFSEACTELMKRNRLVPAYTVSAGSAPIKKKVTVEEIAAKYGIRSNTSVEQSRYIRYTALPVPQWLSGAFNLYTDTNANLCLPNAAGGIHLKGGLLKSGKTFATNVGTAAISIGGNLNSRKWCVVEGVGDLLALVDGAVGDKHSEGEYGYMITNSTGNVENYLDQLKMLIPTDVETIDLFFDKGDKTADKASGLLLSAFPSAVDRRDSIIHGKDLRDTWDSQR